MQFRVRKAAHVLERLGLAMAGASCGLFVAAHVGSSIAALTSQGFLVVMMIVGAIGFYLGIDTPPLAFHGPKGEAGGSGGKIDTAEFLSAAGTFLATLTKTQSAPTPPAPTTTPQGHARPTARQRQRPDQTSQRSCPSHDHQPAARRHPGRPRRPHPHPHHQSAQHPGRRRARLGRHGSSGRMHGPRRGPRQAPAPHMPPGLATRARRSSVPLAQSIQPPRTLTHRRHQRPTPHQTRHQQTPLAHGDLRLLTGKSTRGIHHHRSRPARNDPDTQHTHCGADQPMAPAPNPASRRPAATAPRVNRTSFDPSSRGANACNASSTRADRACTASRVVASESSAAHAAASTTTTSGSSSQSSRDDSTHSRS